MEKHKPLISVAIIARNVEKTLPECIKSLRVAGVEEIVVVLGGKSDDDTEKVARAFADKVAYFEWCNDFAAARDFSFSFCTGDWILWIDADDILLGGHSLKKLVEETPPHIIGWWFPYEYGHDEFGNCTTIFDRERLFRRSVGWTWEFPIHEVCKPNKPGEYLRTDALKIVHRAHDASGSITRNIDYLLQAIEKAPNSPRIVEYLGNQYFAKGDWQKAIDWWETWLEMGDNGDPNRCWWVWLYTGRAYGKLGRWDKAMHCAFCAIDNCATYAEPYFDLGMYYANVREWQKGLHWIEIGRGCKDRPPPWIFQNPLELTFDHRLFASVIYANMGEVRKATEELAKALRIRPVQELYERQAFYKAALQRMKETNAWGRKAQKSQNGIATPADFMLSQPPVQIIWGGHLHKKRAHKEPRMVIFCGRTIEPFAPPRINEGGIGGSETAVVEIAKRFAQDGWQVDVYNEPDKWIGEYDGVGYYPYQVYKADEHCDLFIAWRSPEIINTNPNTEKKVLWLHDLNIGERMTASLAYKYDVIAGVSQFHANYLRKLYPFLAEANLTYFPNGINLERFDLADKPERQRQKCVYLSSPNRGLDTLLMLWPKIMQVQPGAELHIFYGWHGIDWEIAQGGEDARRLKLHLENEMKQPGVVWRGRLGQAELAKELWSSSVWLYPTHFVETSCISAMECMAAGVVPVVTGVGALPETIGDAGLVLPNDATQPILEQYLAKYLGLMYASLFDAVMREPYRAIGMERAKQFTWDKSYEKWKAICLSKQLVPA